MGEKQLKKLRILCFHGYSTNAEIMSWQMKNFMQTFSALCEFTFLDGLVPATQIIDPRLNKLFKPPFLGWMAFKHPSTVHTSADGTMERLVPDHNEVNYDGA